MQEALRHSFVHIARWPKAGALRVGDAVGPLPANALGCASFSSRESGSCSYATVAQGCIPRPVLLTLGASVRCLSMFHFIWKP